MADGDYTIPTYPGVVGVGGGGGRDRAFEAALIASGDDANRDVADAGRDLAMESANAGRDLASAVADAGRDLTAALSNAEQHGEIMEGLCDVRASVLDARGQITDVVNSNSNVVQNLISNSSRETLVNVLDQGSRGRETTLAAQAALMAQHCETQRLVIEKACDVERAVREDGEETRELIREEANAELLRELTTQQNANGLLQLRIDILTGGGGATLK